MIFCAVSHCLKHLMCHEIVHVNTHDDDPVVLVGNAGDLAMDHYGVSVLHHGTPVVVDADRERMLAGRNFAAFVNVFEDQTRDHIWISAHAVSFDVKAIQAQAHILPMRSDLSVDDVLGKGHRFELTVFNHY